MPDSLESPPSCTFLNFYTYAGFYRPFLRFSTELRGQNCFLPTDMIFHKSFVYGFVLSTAEVACFVRRHPGRWHHFGRNSIVVHARVPSWTQVTLGRLLFFIFWTKERQEAGLVPLYSSKMATPTNNRGNSVLLIRLLVFLTEYRFVPLRGKFNSLPSHGKGIELT